MHPEEARIRALEVETQDQYLRMLGEAVYAGLDFDIARRGTGGGGRLPGQAPGDYENDIAQLARACLKLFGPRRLRRDRKNDALITFLIHRMLWGCMSLQRLPGPLVILFDDHFQVHRIGMQRSSRRNKQPSYGGFARAVMYYRDHPTASISAIAKATNNDRRTIRRWLAFGALASGIFPKTEVKRGHAAGMGAK
jgi:hypothetical protein